MMSLDNPKIIRACIAVALGMNICVGVMIIVLVVKTARDGSSQLRNTAFRTAEFKQQVDEIYDIIMEECHQKRTTHVESNVDQNTQEPTLPFLSLLKPVIQLSGLDFDGNNKGTRESIRERVVRNWAKSEGAERSYMWNGMDFSKGSVSVPANGLYRIYSHVKFYVEDNNASDPIRQFKHDMIRYSADNGKQDVVASDVLSECKEGINDGAHLEYPSDVNTLVRLNAGDTITIKVNYVELLIHDIDWHSFGAYLI